MDFLANLKKDRFGSFSDFKESLLGCSSLTLNKGKHIRERMVFLWSLAVGEKVAQISYVRRFDKGTLYVELYDESWATALSPIKKKIIKEMNRPFDNTPIERIEFKKGRIELKKESPKGPKTSPSQASTWNATPDFYQEISDLKMIKDAQLREVLNRLSSKLRFISLIFGLFVAMFLPNCTTMPVELTSLSRGHIDLENAHSIKEVEKRNQQNPDANYRDPRAYYHYLMGRRAQREFDLGGAVKNFEQVVQHDPGNEDFRVLLARLYLMTGRFDKLLEHCHKSLERFPENTQIQLMMADVYSVRGKSQKAISYLGKSLNPKEGELDAFLLAGTIYLQNKEFEQAKEMFINFAHANPGNSLGYHYLGKVQSLTDKLEEAEKTLEHSLSLRPNSKKSLELLAWVLEKQGKYKKAEKLYTNLARLDEKSEKFKDALRRIDTLDSTGLRSSAQLPEDSSVHLKLGIMYFEQRRHARALEKLRLFLSESKSEEKTAVRLLIARIFELYHRYPEAIAELEVLVEKQPNSVDYLLQIARMHNLNKNTPATIEVLHRAVKLSPEEHSLHHSLSLAYMGENKNDKAIEHIRKAIELDAKKDSYYFELGALLERTGNYQEAIDTMMKVIDLNPSHSNAHNFIGYIYALQGENLDRAVHHLEKALAIEPQNGYFLDSLGWVYYKKGEPKKALVEIKKAMIYVEPDPVLYEHLGDVYFTLENYDEANKAWNISLSLTRKKIRQKKIQEQKILEN